MKAKMPRISRRQQRGGPFDLFGEVPVLESDIAAWMAVVAPRIGAWRREWYVRCYDVPSKIRAAKIAGQWPPDPIGNP